MNDRLRAEQAAVQVAALLRSVDSLRGVAGKTACVGVLWELLSIAAHMLEKVARTDGDDPTTQRTIAERTQFLGSLLTYVALSDQVAVPAAAVSSFTELGKRATGNDEFELAVWAEWKPRNYRIHCDVLSDIAKAIKDLALAAGESPNIPRTPCTAVSSIPASEAGDVLQHTVLAHEIGHVVYQGITHKPMHDVRDLSLWQAYAAPSWMKELFCDLAGCALMGPSFAMSMAFKIGVYPASYSHPPTWLRLQHCVDFLRTLASDHRWSAEAGRLVDMVEGEVSIHRKSRSLNGDTDVLQKGFSQRFAEHAARLRKAVHDAPLACQSEAVLEFLSLDHADLRRHPTIDALLHSVPPAYQTPPSLLGNGEVEQGVAADTPTIILAGWLTRTLFWADFTKVFVDDAVKAEAALNRLLLKGLESAHVMTRLMQSSDGA